MMDATDQSPTVSAQTPGQLLRQERESANFSVQYVAEQLRLTESYIHWLEADQFENLPPEPFVLGYYRAYARILSQSADNLIENYHAFRQQQPDSGATATAPKVIRRQEEALDAPASTGFTNRHYAMAIAALVVVWILFSAVMNGGDEQRSIEESAAITASEPTIEANPSDTVPTEEVAVIASGSDNESTAVVADEALVSEAEKPEATDAVAEEFATQKTSSSTLDQLVIRFTDECWLEVTDANDDVVAANLYQKGDDARLQGVAPFTLMLGNVRAAQVSLNGEEIQIQPRGFRKTLRAYVFADGTTQIAE